MPLIKVTVPDATYVALFNAAQRDGIKPADHARWVLNRWAGGELVPAGQAGATKPPATKPQADGAAPAKPKPAKERRQVPVMWTRDNCEIGDTVIDYAGQPQVVKRFDGDGWAHDARDVQIAQSMQWFDVNHNPIAPPTDDDRAADMAANKPAVLATMTAKERAQAEQVPGSLEEEIARFMGDDDD